VTSLSSDRPLESLDAQLAAFVDNRVATPKLPLQK
jgi:hypothetical protein